MDEATNPQGSISGSKVEDKSSAATTSTSTPSIPTPLPTTQVPHRIVSPPPLLRIIPKRPKRPSILDTNRDFVSLFVHQAGKFETPNNFLEWGAISLIAACVAERCYSHFLSKRTKLMPNLYTFLLADSGIGKGLTCDMVNSFLKPKPLKAKTGLEESRTTAQGVMDRLSGRFSQPGSLLQFLYSDDKNKKQSSNGTGYHSGNGNGNGVGGGGYQHKNQRVHCELPDEFNRKIGQLALVETEEEADERLSAQHRIFLVFEELSLSVGSGPRADDFIKFLTKVYGGQGFVDRTRTWGEIDLGEEVCLNVLAGSTHRWLKDCVTLDAVLGGFFARCIVIDGDSDRAARRYWKPKFAHDTDLVRAHLERRVESLIQMEGEFSFTDKADEIGEKWYMDRPDPEDPSLGPIFRRERATVLKLAHIFSLSEGTEDFKIHGRHMARAQAAIRYLAPAVMRVVSHASITKDTRGFIELQDFIRENQPVSHGACAKYMASIGVGSDQFKRLFSMLRDIGGLVVDRSIQKGVCYYSFVDKPRSFHEVGEGDEGDEGDEE